MHGRIAAILAVAFVTLGAAARADLKQVHAQLDTIKRSNADAGADAKRIGDVLASINEKLQGAQEHLDRFQGPANGGPGQSPPASPGSDSHTTPDGVHILTDEELAAGEAKQQQFEAYFAQAR